MSSPERLNVLLSRARDALVIIGNADTFFNARKGRELWTRFLKLLQKDNHVYVGFPVRCQQHPDREADLKTPADFDKKCPGGGCTEHDQHHRYSARPSTITCAKCAREESEAEAKRQMAFELQRKREEEEVAHAQRMADIEEKIKYEQQVLRDTQLIR